MTVIVRNNYTLTQISMAHKTTPLKWFLRLPFTEVETYPCDKCIKQQRVAMYIVLPQVDPIVYIQAKTVGMYINLAD